MFLEISRRFWQLPWRDRLILAEAFFWLSVARPATAVLPFRRIANLAACRTSRQWPSADDRNTIIQRTRWAIHAAAKRVPWKALCFQQGIAAQVMLRRRGIASTLYYGAALDQGDELSAHVWVRDGDIDVVGCDQAGRYAVLATFPYRTTDSEFPS